MPQELGLRTLHNRTAPPRARQLAPLYTLIGVLFLRVLEAGGQVLHENCSLNGSSASSSSQTFSTVRVVFGGLVIGVNHSLDRGQKWSLNCD